MSLIEEVDLLKKIPLFANIEVSKLKLLAFTSERVKFGAGETLFRQDDMGDAAYIIMDGEADVVIDTDKGPVTVATLHKNDFVGEIAILCDVPRTAEFPQMAVEIMRELALRLEKTTKAAVSRSND